MSPKQLRELEPAAGRIGAPPTVSDPEAWTLRLTQSDHFELDAALRAARSVSNDPLRIGRDDFPLNRLAVKLADITHTLLDGRGFVRISTLDVGRYTDEQLTLLYWGIGLHLGRPVAQNHHGHVLADVTDQGKKPGDPTARGNEMGQIALDYHTDGSDLRTPDIERSFMQGWGEV